MSAKKRFIPFQKGHALQYGLRVTDVDPKTKLIPNVDSGGLAVTDRITAPVASIEQFICGL